MADTAAAAAVTSSDQALPGSLLDLPRLETWFTERGLKPIHLRKVYNAMFRGGVGGGGVESPKPHPSAATATLDPLLLLPPPPPPLTVEDLVKVDIARADAEALLSAFVPCTAECVDRQSSEGGGQKLVVRLSSGRLVETVLIRHEHVSSGRTRHTVCVSSQVGCARACTFCATGTMGLHANLKGHEILEQVWIARHVLAADASGGGGSGGRLRNVVFMGMGEPLDNYGAVHEALRGLTHQCLFGLASKHCTVSTVGQSGAHIKRLAADAPQVQLAISLHGATEALRSELIPASRGVPLPALAAALDHHAAETGRGCMVEYLLIAGVNDQPDHADALAAFCQARAHAAAAAASSSSSSTSSSSTSSTSSSSSSTLSSSAAAGRPLPETSKVFVNLIPYNPTLAGLGLGYATPSDAAVNAFHARLRAAGVASLIRWSSAQGRDTNGACGQLALAIEGKYPDAPRDRRRDLNKAAGA